jgi:hypothetical protein
MGDALMAWARAFWEVFCSVAPLIGLLLVLKVTLFRTPFESAGRLGVGIVFALVGLFVFLHGVNMSMIPLADETGASLARLGRPLILLVVFGVGLAATLVEPGLQTVVKQAEEVSQGAYPAKTLVYLTAAGFGFGALLGALKIVYNIEFYYVLAPLLVLAVILAKIAPAPFPALAFDCASAATGPVNIPVNLAIALGLARSVGADSLTAGFGIVGLTSLGATTAVLVFGALRGGA